MHPPDFWPFRQSPSSIHHSPAAAYPYTTVTIPPGAHPTSTTKTLLTLGLARSSPAHPAGSPRWDAHPQSHEHHFSLAFLLLGVQPSLPLSCCSLGQHSEGQPHWAVMGFCQPHLKKREQKKHIQSLIPHTCTNHRQVQNIVQKSCGTSIFKDIKNNARAWAT